jgi:hypothetical protein
MTDIVDKVLDAISRMQQEEVDYYLDDKFNELILHVRKDIELLPKDARDPTQALIQTAFEYGANAGVNLVTQQISNGSVYDLPDDAQIH